VVQRLFRQDLYYRLNVMHVEMPPLRARDEDVQLFATHFLAQLAGRYDATPPVLDSPSLAWLKAHSWPGNIRELENLMEREFLLCEGEPVLHLSFLDRREWRQAVSEERWNYRLAKAHVVAEFDRRFLQQLMRYAQGNVALAARTSGKERRDLGRLLRKYEIAPHEFRGE
jgi:DNA-binding NtrC family response regulator